MTLTLLTGKIHRATVTQADLDYVGSITIDEDLLDAAGILEYQHVEVANLAGGQRFATYTIAGERGSGIVCLNGATAHCGKPGDKVIIMAFGQLSPEEAQGHKPSVVFVNEGNKPVRVANYEKHGRLQDNL